MSTRAVRNGARSRSNDPRRSPRKTQGATRKISFQELYETSSSPDSTPPLGSPASSPERTVMEAQDLDIVFFEDPESQVQRRLKNIRRRKISTEEEMSDPETSRDVEQHSSGHEIENTNRENIRLGIRKHKPYEENR